ncbi:hypothetical protein BJX68DRAFT_223006 [Aspergillus pseudodeflectus]|uniref:Uncharacterized protein n=1 Tax=Aspergillus pseudodeflectus TaxID=176178 RepID=A0ABR4LAU8_9EURO
MPAYNEVPNSVRVILIALTAISFLPQLYRLDVKKNSLGISPSYVLCNLIVATEQFAILFYLLVSVPEAGGDMLVHEPRTAGDWLNFAQLATTWVLFLTLFILTITYRPAHREKRDHVIIYILYLLITLVPLFLDFIGLTPYFATPEWPETDLRENWAFIHGLFLNTLMPAFAFLALFPQMAQIWKHVGDTEGYPGLSVLGLAIQAWVFVALAVSWAWRISYSDGDYGKGEIPWFWSYGWPVVETGMIAAVQAFLVLVAWWRGSVERRERRNGLQGLGEEDEDDAAEDWEREPLLQQ